MPRNELLLPFQNPLIRRLGAGFFRRLPKAPGIYRMFGESGQLLYVGKAKCLQDRLNSYRHAKPGSVPRKTLRLIHLIRTIEIETLGSETEALLRENALLRTLQPPFNRANTAPDRYLLIGLQRESGSPLRFLLGTEGRLMPTPEGPLAPSTLWFGAFKARRQTQHAYAALLRLLWLVAPSSQNALRVRFEFPQTLVRERPPEEFCVSTGPLALVEGYLRGESPALLAHLTENLLEIEAVPPFYYKMLQDDLEALRTFYETVCVRNRRIIDELPDPGRTWIPGALLDDSLVRARVSKA